MRKKVISAILSIAMLISTCCATSSAYVEEAVEHQIGYLIDDEGNVQEVYAEIVDTPMLLDATTDEYQVTYEYAIAATDYTLEANPNGYGISVFLTIRYRQRNTPAEVLLTSISGEWEITDSRCSVTESNLHYGCTGVSTNVQSGYCAVNNGFVKNTGFSQYALKSDDVLVGSSVGAYICFKMLMGTSRQYTFVAPNFVCGGLEDDFSCPIC